MNLVDLAVAVLVAVAAGIGARTGVTGRVATWLGASGGALGGLLVGYLVAGPVADPGGRAVLALALVVAGVAVGAGVGAALDLRARPPEPERDDAPGRLVAAILAGAGALALVWVTAPVLRGAPDPVGDAAAASTVLDALDDLTGVPPGPLRAWTEHLTRPDPRLPSRGIPAATAARASSAVVRVTGRACGTVQDGSGWVVEPGLVVTNAHVVEGSPWRQVIDGEGRALDAVVVAFDPDTDLALLEVAGLDAPALPALRPAEPDEPVAVPGHPGGGGLRVAPARVREEIVAVSDRPGADDLRRPVLVLDASLAVGDSGAPVVAADGAPVGTVFAIAPDEPGTAYALSAPAHDALLAAVRVRPTDTGECPAG